MDTFFRVWSESRKLSVEDLRIGAIDAEKAGWVRLLVQELPPIMRAYERSEERLRNRDV